jgi:predicted dehydrogenase
LQIQFRSEYERHLRVALVGCGGHAHRNILPALNYLPVELVATCDIDAGRAAGYARTFGAERSFGSYEELLNWAPGAGVEAVLLVLGYVDGLPQYADFAVKAMERGLHVWMEKPPASKVDEVERMLAVQKKTGRTVQVGYKHYFFPSLREARAITKRPDFGRITSMSASYQLLIAPSAERATAGEPVNLNLCHPGSAIHLLMGDYETVWFDRAPNGGGVVAFGFTSGAIGMLHGARGKSGTAPGERFEVVGDGANVVVDNVTKLTYYQPGKRGGPGEGYGRTTRFMGPLSQAPLHWEPEFNLGQMYSMTLFLQGYVQEIAHFVECVWAGRQPAHANLRDALHLTHLFEAFRAPEKTVVTLPRLDPMPDAAGSVEDVQAAAATGGLVTAGAMA